VGNPNDVYEILRSIYATLDDDQEHLILLVLNVANNVIGFKLIASGAQDSTLVDAKVIFRNALLLGARNIIIAHNHPSGNLNPSEQDLQVTMMLAASGRLLDLPLLDHIIVTAERGYPSLAETHPQLFRPA